MSCGQVGNTLLAKRWPAIWDTGILIRHLRGRKSIVQLVRSLSRTDRLAVATITCLEIYAGLRENEAYLTRKLLSRFVNLPLDTMIAERAGALVAQSAAANQPLSIPDAIIAATAIRHHLTLVSLNIKDFAPISGLSLYPIEN